MVIHRQHEIPTVFTSPSTRLCIDNGLLHIPMAYPSRVWVSGEEATLQVLLCVGVSLDLLWIMVQIDWSVFQGYHEGQVHLDSSLADSTIVYAIDED